MKRIIQISGGVILVLIILSSGLILGSGYADTTTTEQQAISLPMNRPVKLQVNSKPVQLDIQPQATNGDTQRTVNVSGSGQVNARPDQAIIRLGVQTEAESAQEALSQNSANMQALLDSLKQAGVASEDIQTTNIQLRPQYQNQPEPQSGPPRVVGYVATNTVEVRVRNLDQLGEMLDAAVAAGGNTIQGIRFEVSDTADLLDQARAAAMEDATHKAEQLASLANAQLGEVLTIQESSRIPRPVAREAVAISAANVPVEPGTESITVDVQVSWLLR